MMTLASLVFWTWFSTTQLLVAAAAVLGRIVSGPFDPKRAVPHMISCLGGGHYYQLWPFWKVTVQHRERLPKARPCVVVVNHQSLGDILLLFHLRWSFKFVSKKTVFYVPGIGQLMWASGYVPLDRSNRASAGKMLRHCQHWLDMRVPVLFFPEGTRSLDGLIQSFKMGAFNLAFDKQVTVLPILLDGCMQTLPKHGFVIQRSSHMFLRILPEVDSTQFANAAELRDHVHALMVREHEQLRRERKPMLRGRFREAQPCQTEPEVAA